MVCLKKLLPLCFALAALAAPGAGMADPWKDENGWDHRGDRHDRDRWDHHDRGRGHRWDDRRGRGYGHHPPPIPFGHLPPPGEYRLWFLDRPPGRQPPPYRW